MPWLTNLDILRRFNKIRIQLQSLLELRDALAAGIDCFLQIAVPLPLRFAEGTIPKVEFRLRRQPGLDTSQRRVLKGFRRGFVVSLLIVRGSAIEINLCRLGRFHRGLIVLRQRFVKATSLVCRVPPQDQFASGIGPGGPGRRREERQSE